jgi:hypothetical protein
MQVKTVMLPGKWSPQKNLREKVFTLLIVSMEDYIHARKTSRSIFFPLEKKSSRKAVRRETLKLATRTLKG